jgi:TPP-dependent pyruvate/acetoin dehydrogenase alpha subunit
MPAKNKKQRKTTTKRHKAKRGKTKPSAASKSKGKAVVAAVLDAQKLQDLYATMLKAHMLNQRAGEILAVRQKSVSAKATSGREAVLVGAIAHALPGDAIAASHGGFLGSFIRGTALRSVLEQISAGELQPSGNGSAEQNVQESSAEITTARGMAQATEIKGKPNVVLIFPGESPAGPVTHHDTLALAATNKLPLVCVMETRSSASSNVEQQGAGGNSSTNAGRSFPQITVDGNDVVAVFRVAQEAVRRARTGHGPSLIECVMDHAAAPPATRKLPKHTNAPLAFMQQYLQRRSLWSDEWQRKMADEFKQELDAAILTIGNSSAGQRRVNQVYYPDRPASSTQSLP